MSSLKSKIVSALSDSRIVTLSIVSLLGAIGTFANFGYDQLARENVELQIMEYHKEKIKPHIDTNAVKNRRQLKLIENIRWDLETIRFILTQLVGDSAAIAAEEYTRKLRENLDG